MKTIKPSPANVAADTAVAHAQPPRKRGRPVQPADQSLRQALIERAAELFRHQGYGQTSVRDIAAAAGVQAGSWFYHFKTKQEILHAVIKHGMTQALAEIESLDLAALPPREALWQLVRVHLNTLLAPHHDFVPVMLYEWHVLSEDERASIIGLKDRYEAIWDGVLERLQVSGEWAAPTRLDRLFLFGMLNWTVQWYRPDAGVGLDELADQALQFLLRSER
ncbi:MAG: TetR family transcriptional regulator [Burkholderiaceae bacterium]|nr:TetR family transcriptional regulator [Burkholderiaceae bacterium]